MRFRLAVLMLLLLLAVLPLMNVLAAPAPYPSAVLAIGPSPYWNMTNEEYRKGKKEAQNSEVMALQVWHDPEVMKLPLIARMKNPRSWLAKYLRVVEAGCDRRFGHL